MFTEHLGKYAISNCLLSPLILIMYDELWSEIQDMSGEIFDIIDDDNPENNVKCDEFAQENYTVWIMTQTVNVLTHINELKKVWRDQNFRFTPDQQLQMDMLMQARRERVDYFRSENLVWKGPYQSLKKIRGLDGVEEEGDDWNSVWTPPWLSGGSKYNIWKSREKWKVCPNSCLKHMTKMLWVHPKSEKLVSVVK